MGVSAADRLRLGGNVDSSFDVSTIGRQYRDFGIYEKTGTGTWTLNGSTSEVTSWTIGQGTLSVWLDAHLGAASGALTFDGGVLRVMSTMFTATSRTINWGPGGGGFDIADSANNFTVSQALTGQGGLTKLGAGTLTLTGINIYSGGTVVNGGTLRIGGDWALGDVSGALTLNGGALQVTGSPLNFTLERQVILGANGGTFDVGAGKNLILDGVVSGDGQLAKTSSGTLTLNSANSYSGGTAVRGGGLVVAATGALGDGPVTISSNGSGGWAKLYSRATTPPIPSAPRISRSPSGWATSTSCAMRPPARPPSSWRRTAMAGSISAPEPMPARPASPIRAAARSPSRGQARTRRRSSMTAWAYRIISAGQPSTTIIRAMCLPPPERPR
ncbi:autotransporter-associated beta strand repeat-containing protein [Mesorhizobium sp. M0243]|uniref:autotransporter-associated beta strand repeat-containing protein n=1 Tax=Mesorhizobium sp. M0243 TaxID=2956925 RepID=UPI00333D2219